MKVVKVINNNAVYSMDERRQEIIVVGKGVGFQKRTGDVLDNRKVEKIFRFNPELNSRFAQLVAEIPLEHIHLAEEIIRYAGKALNKPLNQNIYITLTDHLSFAIARHKKGIVFQNALLWEIKKFYQLEFEIGLWAVEQVRRHTGLTLSEDEAGFFALHIVNAEMEGESGQAAEFPTIIRGALNIVCYYLGLQVDESSISYERFITHLKFLMQRMSEGRCYTDTDTISQEMERSIRQNYPKSYRCAKKVHAYIRQRIPSADSEEELIYLTIHIERIAQTSPKADA